MWDPEQYKKFENERMRPALELISRIPDVKFSSILDLGCGSGKITKILKDKYQPQNIIGLDNSKSMLAKAENSYPDICWQLKGINEFTGEHDLIFSNPALHWVDNHEELMNKIISCAKQMIAIQLPNNFSCPSHILLLETINENPIFKDKLSRIIRVQPVLSATEYFKLFYKKVSSVDIWQTCYLHQVNGKNAVLEWVKGSILVPIKNNLSATEYSEFLAKYNEKLLTAYPPLCNGTTLFPFNRVFIIAKK